MIQCLVTSGRKNRTLEGSFRKDSAQFVTRRLNLLGKKKKVVPPLGDRCKRSNEVHAHTLAQSDAYCQGCSKTNGVEKFRRVKKDETPSCSKGESASAKWGRGI